MRDVDLLLHLLVRLSILFLMIYGIATMYGSSVYALHVLSEAL